MTSPPRPAPPARLPYARTLVALQPDHFETIRRTVAALFRVAHREAYQRAVDAGAGPVARHRPRNAAVFMSYDFHLTPEGPRLIEINTNAGGALVNGLHTASLLAPPELACRCRELLPVDTMRERLVDTFRAEHAAACPGTPLTSVAIADDEPASQFLHEEFELMRGLLEDEGIGADVCDVRELERRVEGGLALRGRRLDLVYLRDVDWCLEASRSAALRAAYLADEVVLTPSPREHHLLAHKARLVLFSDPARLIALGATAEEAALLAAVVPETRLLAGLGLETAWRTRNEWVFKPVASHASRAVYRGDKISRRKLEEIVRNAAQEPATAFVAQRRVEPARVTVAVAAGGERTALRPMKFDVRAYAYRDQVLLLGARVYEGQVTNLRTPGGGFSAICVVGEPGT